MLQLKAEAAIEDISDGVERLKQLRTRINGIDPQYNLEVVFGPVEAAQISFPRAVLFRHELTNQGPVTIAILPKYRDAVRDRPMFLSTTIRFPDTVIGRQAADEFRNAVEYGDAVELPPEYVVRATIDAPAGLGGEFGPSLLNLRASNDLTDTPIDAGIAVVDEHGIRLASIPLRFNRRHAGQRGAKFLGIDHTGIVAVTTPCCSADNRRPIRSSGDAYRHDRLRAARVS
ncbi:hypothetical protein [Dactylosporangium sp. CS-033363]|uniref:hypothetical protein n=1 Tax=Dactylosporangium sp. CS-033363 TaxID=3239935 RepID=UPI003D914F45